VLTVLGITLVEVALTGHSLHLDGGFSMVDRDLALVNSGRLPYWFFQTLEEHRIRTIEVHHADNPRVINCLAVRPGKVLMAINNGDATAERLRRSGVEVVALDYSECQHAGGGIHCSTLPLIRERS
jgi:N-dimethylarginine dimethylaminohydrolase